MKIWEQCKAVRAAVSMPLPPASGDGTDSYYLFVRRKKINLYIGYNSEQFDIVPVFSFNVANVVFHVIDKNIAITKNPCNKMTQCRCL